MLAKPGALLDGERVRYVEPNGNVSHVSAVVGVPGRVTPGPQAFLLDLGNAFIGPHFHRVDQFQVLMQGRARYGRWPASFPWAHYADAYTTYGPIDPVSGTPLVQFTLRLDADDTQFYMPESRPLKVMKSRRNLVALHPDAPILSEVVGAGEVRQAPTLGPIDDGLASYVVRAGVGAEFVLPSAAESRGAYWVVLRGEIDIDGTAYDERSCGHYGPDESIGVSVGRSEGTVFVVQFPRRSDPAR